MSSEHAVIHHSGGRWEVRDLGSTNGTWVNKTRLHKGERMVLAEGSILTFGGRDLSFELVDGSSPVACARHLRTNELKTATNGVLALPNDDDPVLQLFESVDGRWQVDSQDEHRYVADRDVVIVQGEGWSLELPDSSSTTLDTARLGPFIEAVTLRFAVSPDEEHITLTLVHDGGETSLGTRQYHLPLLVLARAWAADVDAPQDERGWLERETLCRALSVDANKLNVDIYRARKQLVGIGVLGAANVVLRRIDTGHLRLGVASVEILKGGVPEIPGPRAHKDVPPPKPIVSEPARPVSVTIAAPPGDSPEPVKDTIPDDPTRDTSPDATTQEDDRSSD